MMGRAGAALAAAALASLGSGPAEAQEFRGAELSIEALASSEADDLASTTYRGSVEAGLFGGFGVQADLSFYDLHEGDGVGNATVHALYDGLEAATLGLFYARESLDGSSADAYGVEAGRSFGRAGVEAFLGFGDEDGADFRLMGADGTFDLTRNLSLTASAAALDRDGGDARRLSVGGEYRFGDRGPALYAEVGRLSADDAAGGSDSGTFVGLGGRIALGPNRGTTFESRGLAEVVSGF